MPAAFLLDGVSGFSLVFGPFSRFLAELVVYSSNWSTGSWLFHGFRAFSPFPAELVVHSSKWATSSWLSLCFRAFFPVSDPASGPLFKVGHWLMAFPLFSALFPSFRPS